MVLAKLQYDAYNRRFNLLERDLAGMLEDGETYLVIVDLSPEDLKPDLVAVESSVDGKEQLFIPYEA